MKTILALLASALLVGCAQKHLNAVYIPTKCQIAMPSPPYPKQNDTLAQKYREVLIYTESLEYALRFCIEGK